jgi:hypothetical protein
MSFERREQRKAVKDSGQAAGLFLEEAEKIGKLHQIVFRDLSSESLPVNMNT